MSRREVLIAGSAEDLAQAVAGMLITQVVERQASTGSASIVLTGGGIGTEVLAAVRTSPAVTAIDWWAVDLWWGDERYLPSGHPERNETAARHALLDHVPVDPSRVHPIPGPDHSADAEDAARQVASHLARHAGPQRRLPAFDVLLLGIGPDAHVASLFPELPALHELDRTVVAVHGAPKPPATRITLTLPAINHAREAWIIASGAAKADAVRLTLDPMAGALQAPASGVNARSRTCLLIDRAASSALPVGMGRPIA